MTAAGLGIVPRANATFHEIMIKEIFAGYTTMPGVQYIELQAWAGGQTFTTGRSVDVYNATGSSSTPFTFTTGMSHGEDQMTILLATSAAQTLFGVTPDLVMTTAAIDPNGGAACWATAIDCVSWGNFSGTLPSPAGSPARPTGGIDDPAGPALQRRLDLAGGATTLDFADDHDDSANDFVLGTPSPRNNSGTTGVPPVTTAGTTTITVHPTTPTSDTTPTFEFTSSGSSPPASGLECAVDPDPTVDEDFVACMSPYTSPELQPGSHTFTVRTLNTYGVAEPGAPHFDFVVLDTAPPETTITTHPSDPTSDTTPTFEFEANETSTFACRVDSALEADFASCTSPHDTDTLSVGSHTFEVRATDLANNVDASPASFTFDVVPPNTPDITDPTSQITAPVNGSVTKASALPPFAGTASDPNGASLETVSGVAMVEIALQQRFKSGCKWWDGSAFVAGDCGTPIFTPATNTTSWTYALPGKLKPSKGRRVKVKNYTLFSRAIDVAGNIESSFDPGRNVITFEIK